jgi:hypothetical protein
MVVQRCIICSMVNCFFSLSSYLFHNTLCLKHTKSFLGLGNRGEGVLLNHTKLLHIGRLILQAFGGISLTGTLSSQTLSTQTTRHRIMRTYQWYETHRSVILTGFGLNLILLFQWCTLQGSSMLFSQEELHIRKYYDSWCSLLPDLIFTS